MARKFKYMERSVVSSINIPDSIMKKLEDISADKGVSRSNLILAYIIKGMDEYDVAEILANLDDKFNRGKKEKEVNSESIKGIVLKYITTYIKDIKTSLSKTSDYKEVIRAFYNRLLPYIRTDLTALDLDADDYLKYIKQLIEMNIMKIKGD